MAGETPDIETSSEGYARRFSGAAGHYLLQVQERSIAVALAGLAPGRALDVGGGHGQLVGVLARLGWQVTVLGSDPACSARLPDGVPFTTGDLLNLPFADRSFDLVISVRLISHIQDWPRLLREFCRVADRSVAFDYPSVRSLNALTPLFFNMKKRIEGNTRTYTSFAPGRLAECLAIEHFAVAREVGQFVLPMGVHRALRGAKPLRVVESGARLARLTDVIGSPVIVRADRVA